MPDIENPWFGLDCTSNSLLLECDRNAVERFNCGLAARTDDRAVVSRYMPEPFIGQRTARLLILNLNPGGGEEDSSEHEDPALRCALEKNLRHEIPFLWLQKELHHTAGHRWWAPKLRDILEQLRMTVPLAESHLAKRIAALEWFPYHSKKFAWPRSQPVPSSEYVFDWVRRHDGPVLLFRGRRYWQPVLDGSLAMKRSQVFMSSNPQNPSANKTQLGERDFQLLMEWLT